MARLSETEQDWQQRVQLSNYRCRDCKELITFPDQQLYFQKGLCTPCKNIRDEEQRGAARAAETPSTPS